MGELRVGDKNENEVKQKKRKEKVKHAFISWLY